MLERRPVFPGVIEMNHQAGWRIGCNVYLVYDDRDWALIDIGYEESVDEIVEMIRQMDFPLSQCRALVATHADVDHIQGLAKAKSILKAPVLAHAKAVESLESGDRVKTFAEIAAQNVHMDMPTVKVDRTVADGDVIEVGSRRLDVWHTPGHTDSQLAFRLGNLLLSGDNIYRDGLPQRPAAARRHDRPARGLPDARRLRHLRPPLAADRGMGPRARRGPPPRPETPAGLSTSRRRGDPAGFSVKSGRAGRR